MDANPSAPPELLEFLVETALIPPGSQPQIALLGGGVSSDVWLVEPPGQLPLVVKRNVAQLRVRADWRADPARLRYEFLYLQTLGELLPGHVPQLLWKNPAAPFLVLEYLGAGWANWKQQLLSGLIELETASRVGSLLGQIHARTTGNPAIAARFPSLEYFFQLRIEAYLESTAARQPKALADWILREAERLRGHREGLVHGDFSPKNLLVGPERVVVIDCETACYGDPAFDLAFVLNHLLLKALYHTSTPQESAAAPALLSALRQLLLAYKKAHPSGAPEIFPRAARLLPMLLLARVDGKSPVEYLDPPRQDFVRRAAPHLRVLLCKEENLHDLTTAWFARLRHAHLPNAEPPHLRH